MSWFNALELPDKAVLLYALAVAGVFLMVLLLHVPRWGAIRRRREALAALEEATAPPVAPPATGPTTEPATPGMPENVAEALKDYIEARLQANGNRALPLGQLMHEFALWHGAKNLRAGVLRDTPPPLPETTVVSGMAGEC